MVKFRSGQHGNGVNFPGFVERRSAKRKKCGDRAMEHGRVGYVKGRPEPTAKLGLGVQSM